jgi:PAS domain-containing protein
LIWTFNSMIEAGQPSAQEGRAQELQRAFDAFNQVSQALTTAYQGLQGRVESLTIELATANGELRRQHDAKEALAERLRLLLNALPAGVIVLDGDARVTEANPAARRILGREIVGELWPALLRRSAGGRPKPRRSGSAAAAGWRSSRARSIRPADGSSWCTMSPPRTA